MMCIPITTRAPQGGTVDLSDYCYLPGRESPQDILGETFLRLVTDSREGYIGVYDWAGAPTCEMWSYDDTASSDLWLYIGEESGMFGCSTNSMSSWLNFWLESSGDESYAQLSVWGSNVSKLEMDSTTGYFAVNCVELGFYDATPVARQSLSASPTAAQIATVLENLGLVEIV